MAKFTQTVGWSNESSLHKIFFAYIGYFRTHECHIELKRHMCKLNIGLKRTCTMIDINNLWLNFLPILFNVECTCQIRKCSYSKRRLTHWGRVTHICVVKLTIIGSDNGLSPGRRQAIIWTNAGILLIGPLGTNFIEILAGIQTFSFKKMHLKMSSAKWRPFCLGLNVLTLLAWITEGVQYPHLQKNIRKGYNELSTCPIRFSFVLHIPYWTAKQRIPRKM